ncbi:MAG: hypothetical protein LBQ16_06870, partial [Gracilibacteraceae bacterium]|nr:hypothetical protein [Gracilibacteraceae bacterium]
MRTILLKQRKTGFQCLALLMLLATAFTPAFLLPAWAASSDAVIDLADTNPAAEGDGWIYSNGLYTIQDGANVTVTGSNGGSTRRIEVAAGAAAVTLDNASIYITDTSGSGAPVSLQNGANLTLTLAGESALTGNLFYAGIYVPSGAALTVTGSGKLIARGGDSDSCGGA